MSLLRLSRCPSRTVFLVALIGLISLPFDAFRNGASPTVAAEVLTKSPWVRRSVFRTRREREEKKNGVPTNVPTPAPVKGKKEEEDNASDLFVSTGNDKNDNSESVPKQNAPTASPTIPKESRQTNLPPIFPPSFLNPPTVPSPVVTPTAPSPVAIPASVPVAIPASVPVMVPAPSVPVPVTSKPPSLAPVTNATLPPSLQPTRRVNVSEVPTGTPTEKPVSEAPSDVPTGAPSVLPSQVPSGVPSDVPTAGPSFAPTSTPSIALDRVDETVGILQITYLNVGLLNESDIVQLEKLTEDWFEEYYNEGAFINRNETSSNQTNATDAPRRFLRPDRHLQQTLIRNMTTIIAVDSQNVSPDGSSNVVSYYQQLIYLTYPDSNEMPETLAIVPFRKVVANNEYRDRLMSEISAFENVGDIEPPILIEAEVPTAPTPPAPAPVAPTAPVSREKESLSSGAIAGIAVGGLVVLALVTYGLIIYPHELKARNAAANVPSEVPAASAEDAMAKDVLPPEFTPQGGLSAPATGGAANAGEIVAVAGVAAAGAAVGATVFSKKPEEDTSTLGGYSEKDDGGSYAGGSVDTSDFDYSKVGHSTANSSQLTNKSPDISEEPNAAPITDDINLDENQYVVYAPAGKLGLVVDNPDDGAPVVHAIKEDSVLIDQVQVGDRLIGVDEVDVRQLSPVKVSKLISKRSTNPLRKLTLVRGKPYVDDDGDTADGGDTTSQMESQMETDTLSESVGVAPMQRHRGKSDSDDETSHVGSMSHLSGEDHEESVMDYPDDASSMVDAMSHTSGDVLASATSGMEAKDEPAGGTNVGEETAEVPAKKNSEDS